MSWGVWLACAALWQALATGVTTEAAGCKDFTKNCASNMSETTTEYTSYGIIFKLFSDEVVAHLFDGARPWQPPCPPRGLPLSHALPGSLCLPYGEEDALRSTQSITLYELVFSLLHFL